MKSKAILLLSAILVVVDLLHAQGSVSAEDSFQGYPITDKGAWCWFADPRATHYESADGSIKNTFIGYIDVHGNIKATQYNHLTATTNEVLVRSWFQPDDHNNPTFLALPNGRIMIFYSRHTDEKCFYYRISQKPGDITTLGEEKKLETDHNTTYPSPYILSDDPEHIYLVWRGIQWHPTIARLTMPDPNDDIEIDRGPYQMVSYHAGGGGARPYAKYASNGKDRLYMTFTTTHPDNQPVNYVYFSYIDITNFQLLDVRQNVISNIEEGPHRIWANDEYSQLYPNMVVDSSPYRNWIWQVAPGENNAPVIAMVRIDESKTSHEYYQARWTGDQWQRIFLADAGGHFHQSPDIELCYSGGLAIDTHDSNVLYGSVPVEGAYGTVYEIIKYTVQSDGTVLSAPITRNSEKNNARPYALPHSGDNDLSLTWMHGDYYDWIVSEQRPQGYPTGIHSNWRLPAESTDLDKKLKVDEDLSGQLMVDKESYAHYKVCAKSFTIALSALLSPAALGGQIVSTGKISYGLDEDAYPILKVGDTTYKSTNVLGNSDAWRTKPRSTNGRWYEPVLPEVLHLVITYNNKVLRTYINGLLDQSIEMDRLRTKNISVGGFQGEIDHLKIYKRALSQAEVKALF